MTLTDDTWNFWLADADAEGEPAALVADEGELLDMLSIVPVTSTRLPAFEASSDWLPSRT